MQTTTVTFGKYHISKLPNGNAWIQIDGEEGQEVHQDLFKAFLHKFFWEHF